MRALAVAVAASRVIENEEVHGIRMSASDNPTSVGVDANEDSVDRMVMPVLWVSGHAIQRWRERTGCTKSDQTIANRILDLLLAGKTIGANEWYSRGWVVVMKRNVIITVTRPRKLGSQARLYALAARTRGSAETSHNSQINERPSA